MKRIIKLTESDLTRIIKRVIKESYVSEIYNVITPEEIQKFKEDIDNLFKKHIVENMIPGNNISYSDLQFDYNLWRKKFMSKYIRRSSKNFGDEIEFDELSDNQKDEWKELWKKNINTIGKLFEELISDYEGKYNNIVGTEDKSNLKKSIGNILEVLYHEYQTYLEHIMYPKKHKD